MGTSSGPKWFSNELDLSDPVGSADKLTDGAIQGFNRQSHEIAQAKAAIAQCLYLQEIANALDDIRLLLSKPRGN